MNRRWELACATAVLLSVQAAHADTVETPLSLYDAVVMAAQRNTAARLIRSDIELAADDVAIARTVFTPKVIGATNVLRDSSVGAEQNFATTDTNGDASVGVAGKLETGTEYIAKVGFTREQVDNPFLAIYSPAYTTGLTLSLTHPLLRGSGRGINTAPIVIARTRGAVAAAQLNAQLEKLVAQVETAYWNLALAYKTREARLQSLHLAQDQVTESQRLVKLGNLSELDVTEARAGVGRAEQALARAQLDLIDADGRLRALVVGDSLNVDEIFKPSDEPEVGPVPTSVDDELALARVNRLDIKYAHAQVLAELAAIQLTEDALRPQVDLLANVGLSGFAGNLNNNYATQGVLQNTLSPSYAVNSDAQGSIGRSLINTALLGGYTIGLGLKIEIPIGESTARARHVRQLHAVARAKIGEETVNADLANEVRTSLATLKGQAALEQTAIASVDLQGQLLAGVRKRFGFGAITSFDVLRVADELTRAQIEAARARVSYRISLSRLAAATGTWLKAYGIVLEPSRPPVAPTTPVAP